MTTQHTPGPWKVYQGSHVSFTHIETDYSPHRLNATRLATVTARNPEVEQANARLIAAAPDMLELLRGCEHALRSYQHGNSSPELAKEVADRIEARVKQITL